MNKEMKKWIEMLKPYKGVIYFMALLLISHYLWNFIVKADPHEKPFIVLGTFDLTNQLQYMSQVTARIIYWFVRLFPNTDNFIIKDTILYFTGGKIKINIIWGCTAIKQLYIFVAIMLFYPGPAKKKIWYIPLGCLILWIYNIIRIACIIFLTKGHPERFDFLHEGLFKYIFYGLIFLLWVVWEEVYAQKGSSVAKKRK